MTAPTPAWARDLLEALRPVQRATTGAELFRLLEGWGFVRRGEIDPENPGQVTFVIHSKWPHLQMDIPAVGPVHRYVAEQAVGLVDCVRVLQN